MMIGRRRLTFSSFHGNHASFLQHLQDVLPSAFALSFRYLVPSANIILFPVCESSPCYISENYFKTAFVYGYTTFKHATLNHATLKHGHLNTGQINTRQLKHKDT